MHFKSGPNKYILTIKGSNQNKFDFSKDMIADEPNSNGKASSRGEDFSSLHEDNIGIFSNQCKNFTHSNCWENADKHKSIYGRP